MAGNNSAAAATTIITATLVLGKTYVFNFNNKYYDFRRNTPVEVPEELADKLEMLVKEVKTDDGDAIEKDFFIIDREAKPRSAASQVRNKPRMRIVPVVEREEEPETPRARTAPSGFRPRAANR